MKRFLPTLAIALCLGALAPSTHAWWWPHHRKSSNSAGATSTAGKPKKEKHHKETVEHLYNSPKSWGWFHKSPGPMGAGS
jgi:hypothetical protein